MNEINHNVSYKKDVLSIFVIFFALFICIYVSIIMYIFVGRNFEATNAFTVNQALGVIFLGYISDKYCRRLTAIISQVIGLVVLLLLFYVQRNIVLILLAGFLYNPISVFISGLIDNLPHYSKVKLIALTFVAQNLPWCFYNKLILYTDDQLLFSGSVMLAISLILSWYLFHDRRDKKAHGKTYFSVGHFVHPHYLKHFKYTLIAFLPSQLVYFYLDNLLDTYSNTPEFYSILSLASVFGASFAILYKKTPHVSVLTVIYGVSTLIASVPLICLYLYQFKDVGLPSSFIIFSCLSLFSLPFVYDVILNSVNANHRGLTCGVLECLNSINSVVDTTIFEFFTINQFTTLMIVFILFLMATLIQKKAE